MASPLALAQQYFGVGNTDTRVADVAAFGNAFDNQMGQLAGHLGSSDISAESAVQMSEEASRIEGAVVVGQEWSKQSLRLASAKLQAARLIGNHHAGASRMSLQLTQAQEQYLRQMAPLGLQMGTQTASLKGYRAGLGNARQALLG